MIPNQVTRRVGQLVLLRQNTETPRDEEWNETLRLLTLSPRELESIRVLVVTDGGGPTPEQRKRLNLATGGKPLRAAVVSESVKVRFIVSSVALFMSRVQSFRMEEIDAAFDHLGLGPRERRLASENLAEMSAMVGLAPKKG